MPVTTDKYIKIRARKRTNHQQTTMLSGVGSAMKKVTIKLTAGRG
jgi:hypothetical protein